MFKHILIPTDGSPLSHKAIDMGVRLAKSHGAKVTGVYAAPPATPVVYGDHLPVGYATPKEHERMIKASAARHLGVIARAAKQAKVPFAGMSPTSDYPAEAILAVAKKEKCDLIVMASHGRRGLKGVLLGSETQKVLTHSKIPVLVCR
jgi:nucleotide-binding universal stress UspA family protein